MGFVIFNVVCVGQSCLVYFGGYRHYVFGLFGGYCVFIYFYVIFIFLKSHFYGGKHFKRGLYFH